MADSINSELLSILEKDLSIDSARVHKNSDLRTELGLDSAMLAIVMIAIEERFGTRLSEDELYSCESFGDLEQLVRQVAVAEKRS